MRPKTANYVPNRFSLPDTEAAEDAVQNVVRVDSAGHFAQFR